MRIGYACINMTLGEKNITVNRGMIKKTFDTKGINYVSELVLQNVKDLYQIVKWNHENGITFYRMSSDMFPWMSEYEFDDLPNIKEIKLVLSQVGEYVKEHDHRLTFHPGPFNVLASPSDNVIKKTIVELNKHSQIMDMMGLPESPFSKINIHVGGAYGNKVDSLKRWVDNFQMLGGTTKKRLTIENDDKPNMYSVKDLLYIHEQTGIPIVFDYHHHNCHSDGLTIEEGLKLAVPTWSKDITPIVHISEPRDEKNYRAHHDYIKNEVITYGYDLDLMFESKAKELSVLEYRKNFVSLLIN